MQYLIEALQSRPVKLTDSYESAYPGKYPPSDWSDIDNIL